MKFIIYLLLWALPCLSAELSLDDKAALRFEIQAIRDASAKLGVEVVMGQRANKELRRANEELDEKATAALISQAVVATQAGMVQEQVNTLTTRNIILTAELKAANHTIKLLGLWLTSTVLLIILFFVLRQYIPFLKAL